MNRTRAMRVFMTADAVGGVWQYALDLADGLRPHGVEVTLAVLGPVPSLIQEAAAARAGIALVATGLPLDWMATHPDEVEEAAWKIVRLAIEAEPDVVHLNQPALAATAAFPAPVVAVCHSCVATWWHANRSGPLPAEFAWQADLVGRAYRIVDALVAPTAAFAVATADAYGLAMAPIVVHNGRRHAGDAVQDAPPSIFTAGRLWDEGKNIAALDRAAARLSLPVMAAGPLEGPNGARIGLNHIVPLGRLSDGEVAERLRSRPIFASSARYEPFGLAVLEAAQAGCALVLSDIPSFRELWDGAAVFVAPEEDAAIAQAIETLAGDAEVRARLGRAARDRANAFSTEKMAAGMLGIYRALVADRTDTRSAEEAAA